MLVWALGVAGILLLVFFGGGAWFGSSTNVFAELGTLRQPDISDADVTQALRSRP